MAVRSFSSTTLPVPIGDPQALLSTYLDCLIAPTIGVLPAGERLAIRNEAAFHLEYVAQRFTLEGSSEMDAMRHAIDEYGRSEVIAEDLVLSWYERQAGSRLARRFGRGPVTAFVVFGLAHLCYTAFLQLRVFLPSGTAYSLPLSPADMRKVVPAPLPLPQAWGTSAVFLFAFPVLAPILAGIVTGWLVPVRAGRAASGAQMPLVLYTFVIGSLVLPDTTGIVFALVQLAWWVPMGALCAACSSRLLRLRRMRFREGQ